MTKIPPSGREGKGLPSLPPGEPEKPPSVKTIYQVLKLIKSLGYDITPPPSDYMLQLEHITRWEMPEERARFSESRKVFKLVSKAFKKTVELDTYSLIIGENRSAKEFKEIIKNIPTWSTSHFFFPRKQLITS